MPPATTPPASMLDTGTVLPRVHHHARSARWYGRRDASWRYDAPDRSYGVAYAGLAGPFAEVFLRDPARRELLRSEVTLRHQTCFATIRPLQLAKVHGAGSRGSASSSPMSATATIRPT